MCLGIVGVDLNRFAQGLNRCLRVIPGDLRSFQTEQCFFVTKIGFRCGAKVGFSFLQLGVVQQYLTENEVSYGIGGKCWSSKRTSFSASSVSP